MIASFKDQEAEKIFQGQSSRRLPSDIQRVIERKLRYLHNAQTLNDLRVPPANRLEKLSGNRKDQFSIRINDQWRICFKWQENNAFDVEIVDYH